MWWLFNEPDNSGLNCLKNVNVCFASPVVMLIYSVINSSCWKRPINCINKTMLLLGGYLLCSSYGCVFERSYCDWPCCDGHIFFLTCELPTVVILRNVSSWKFLLDILTYLGLALVVRAGQTVVLYTSLLRIIVQRKHPDSENSLNVCSLRLSTASKHQSRLISTKYWFLAGEHNASITESFGLYFFPWRHLFQNIWVVKPLEIGFVYCITSKRRWKCSTRFVN